MGSRQPGRALPFVRRKYRSRSWLLVGLLAFPLGVGASEDLPRAAPESLGISRAGLDRFVRELGTTVGARSVVVVHRGQVVTEAYWTGTASTLRHVRSVTKSVTSTLVGVAIDRGFIPDVEARMVDYLPTDLVPDDAAKDQIRLRHLLNHSAGFRWDENGEFSSWAGSANPLRFILERPLDSSPGSVFEYSTPATHVLSAMLDEATGSDVESFASLALLHPLGISDWRWEGDPLGYPFGGHGLELRTEDMAKLGVVFLDRGRWGARQVVAAEWIGTATAPHIEGTSSWGPVDNVSYGFLWWVADAGENRIFMAIGWGGAVRDLRSRTGSGGGDQRQVAGDGGERRCPGARDPHGRGRRTAAVDPGSTPPTSSRHGQGSACRRFRWWGEGRPSGMASLIGSGRATRSS